MSERFLKFIPSREALYLARKHKNAFVLLMFIAERARRYHDDPDGLKVGQCQIGDYKEYGLTEKEYRTAKIILVRLGHIKIVETCRTRKSRLEQRKTHNFKNVENWATERATVSTTIGTLVELCKLGIWDINFQDDNHHKGDRKGDRGATEGRPKGEEQEYKEDISNDISKKEVALRAGTHPASPIRARDCLIFNFEKWEFEGIGEKDLASWKVMYPHIELSVEILKAAQWLKNNPSRSNKKQWRKYLTGWFGRANDTMENKKAYRSAAGSNTQDRRTKDINGNVVESPHSGRF